MTIPNLEDILHLARSAKVDDREAAARELQNHPFSAAVRSALLDLMGDSDWRVRRVAIDSLISSRRTEVIPEILYALYEETNAGKRNAALDALNRYGREILPYLDPHLQSKNADVRMFLVNVIGDLRDDRHLSFLTECLRDPEQNLVSAAILALGKIGHPSSIPHLIAMLQHENLWYRFQAIEAAGEMQEEALLPYLIPLLESPYCGKAAVMALGRFHHPSAYKALLDSLIQEEQFNRDVLQAFIENLAAPQPEILRQQDQSVIAKLCGETLSKSQQALFLGELENRLSSAGETPAVQTSAVHHAGVDACVPLQAIKDEDALIRCNALQRMGSEVHIDYREPLMAALADEDARAREYAAGALAAYSSPEVTDALLSSLHDEDVWVRVAIYTSLPLEDHRVPEVFKQQLQLENPIGQAAILRCLRNAKDPATADILFSYSNHPDSEIRASACEALAFFDSDTVRKRLSSLLEYDPSWNVRVAAVQSLDHLQPEGFHQKLLERLQNDDDSSVRKEILSLLQKTEAADLPDIVFGFLRDPVLADSAYQYLLSRSSQKKQILERAMSCAPAVRRIVERIFGNQSVAEDLLSP